MAKRAAKRRRDVDAVFKVTGSIPESDPLVGFETAPTLAVDGFQGAAFNAGTARINFFSLRYDAGQQKAVKKAEFVMAISLPQLLAMREALDKILGELETQGLLTRVPEGANE